MLNASRRKAVHVNGDRYGSTMLCEVFSLGTKMVDDRIKNQKSISHE